MKQEAKQRLLILTSSFPSGPDDETCGYVRQFARCMSSEFDVTVLALADRRAESESGELYNLVRASSLLPARYNPLQASADLNDLRESSVLVKLAAAFALIGFFVKALKLARQANVICSHWLLPSGLIGALLSKLLGTPHVAVEHSGALHLLMNARGGNATTRFIVANSQRVAVVSRDLQRKLIALCPEAGRKCSVIPMGVTINETASPEPTNINKHTGEDAAPSILFIGRLISIKGVDVLLEAMRECEGARLIITGDGPARGALEQLALRFAVNAQFIGQVNAVTRDALLASSSVVVIPSRALIDGRSEGVPVVCLEAMAAGCAVIASRTGGLAEIIRDHHNGLLFEPEDAAALAEKLRRVLNDAPLRERLRQNAKRTASAYAWPRVAASFTRLINDALNNERRFNHPLNDNATNDHSRADRERAAC
ncbi:MAG: glycosyltransferase family 4 protein [Blastocatellia bacterium]